MLGGPPTPQTALAAHSRGVGQLIAAAVEAGATRIVVGLGGTASTDGGRVLVEEIGGLDAGRRRLAGVEVIAACDVEYPLVGPWGAARVFGPQKGADSATVAVLEERIAEWAGQLDTAAGRPVSAESGAGAAGGIGAALLALGGRCESGASIIAEHTGLVDDISAADLVITNQPDAFLDLAGRSRQSGAAVGGHSGGLRGLRLRRFGAAGPRRCRQPADGAGVAGRGATRE